MFRGITLVPQGTNIPFMRYRHLFLAFSALLVISSIALIAIRGLNFGVDFVGGIMIEARSTSDQPADLSALRSDLGRLNLGDVALQEFGSPRDVLIRLPRQEGEAAAQLAAVETVRSTLQSNYEIRRYEFVGPKVGEELRQDALIGIILALGGIALYIWFRYEWQFGLFAIIALIHDCITTVGLFALLGWEFNLTTVAAILTLAGYSVNDTVVVYDRIRDELRRYKTMPMPVLLDKAINETLSRTTVTSGLTLLSVVALFVFGGGALQGFALALIWGIVIGTYSSICVASTLLGYTAINRSGRAADGTPDNSVPEQG